VTYVAFDAVRTGFQASRDVEYSYDAAQPYYLQSGIGYHIGRDLRIGFNVDQERTSELADRAYDALRYGAAITYGR